MQNSSTRKVSFFLLLASPLFLSTDLPFAQDTTGKIEGILKDPQGAVGPNALVTANNLRTGAKKLVRSDMNGNFALVLLPIGEYRLTVEVNNFSKYIREPITLNEYKISPRLTLNLGLRYQINTSYTETNNRLAGFKPGHRSRVFPNAPLGLVYPGDPGVAEGLTPVYHRGFAPRFGLGWDPTGSGKMSVSTSYGIYFEPVANGQGGILQASISAPPYLQARQVQGIFLSAFGIPGAPTFEDPFQGETNPFPTGNSPTPLTHLTVEDHLLPPYVQDWNLSLQRELAQKYVVEVCYVGTEGTRLPHFIEDGRACQLQGSVARP
jgi:carboxypeptidase family protein/TonB-dependent receptor-like protein